MPSSKRANDLNLGRAKAPKGYLVAMLRGSFGRSLELASCRFEIHVLRGYSTKHLGRKMSMCS